MARPGGGRTCLKPNEVARDTPAAGDGIAWERGRSRPVLWPPLSFSAMLQATPVGGIRIPGRRRAMAPFPVDPSGGDGRGCARLGAGGTPALPGSLHPMTSSHQGHKIAETFWRRLSLKEVHLSSGLFVRVHSWFIFLNGRPFSSNDPPVRAGAGLFQFGREGMRPSAPN